MSRYFLCLYLCVSLITLIVINTSSFAAQDASDLDAKYISARFEPDQVQPGEVFELIVEMSRPDYGEFELSVSPHERLSLIDRRRSPVELIEGSYKQREVLVLQALSSGLLRMEQMKCLVKTAKHQSNFELPVLLLNVMPFDASDGTLTAEPIPDLDAENTQNMVYLIAGLCGGALLACALLFIRKRTGAHTYRVAEAAESLSLHANQDIDTDKLADLLESNRTRFSDSLIQQLETLIYKGQGQVVLSEELAALLKRELSS